MTRRELGRTAAGFAAAGIGATRPVLSQSAAPLTAGEVVERIRRNVGIPWRDQTVDKLIAGAPETPVRGIATTMMATLDVVERAAEAGCNMVVTHEPTFYSHQDRTDNLTGDPVYKYKLDFLRAHDMAVFHFHDHWHGHKPDGIAVGMMRELGWEKNVDAENPRLFSFPGTPLADFASGIQTKLKIRTMRVVGDPSLRIGRAIASWGNCSLFPGIPLLVRPDIDALIIGETHEWELVEYAQDTIRTGQKKALIVLGHVVSEQAGMKYCAEWLKPFVPEVPVTFIAAPEPFWTPA